MRTKIRQEAAELFVQLFRQYALDVLNFPIHIAQRTILEAQALAFIQAVVIGLEHLPDALVAKR